MAQALSVLIQAPAPLDDQWWEEVCAAVNASEHPDALDDNETMVLQSALANWATQTLPGTAERRVAWQLALGQHRFLQDKEWGWTISVLILAGVLQVGTPGELAPAQLRQIVLDPDNPDHAQSVLRTLVCDHSVLWPDMEKLVALGLEVPDFPPHLFAFNFWPGVRFDWARAYQQAHAPEEDLAAWAQMGLRALHNPWCAQLALETYTRAPQLLALPNDRGRTALEQIELFRSTRIKGDDAPFIEALINLAQLHRLDAAVAPSVPGKPRL